jgi:hypothetical protein
MRVRGLPVMLRNAAISELALSLELRRVAERARRNPNARILSCEAIR